MLTHESSENPALRILEISGISSDVILRASSFFIEAYPTPAASRGFVSRGWKCLQLPPISESAAARQSSDRRLNIVDALDVKNPRDAFDRAQYALELLAVVDVERHFHARVQRFAAALKRANVRTSVADCAGDAGENSGAVFSENSQAHWERCLRRASPLHRNAPLNFI